MAESNPALLPEWATDGAADIVEPTSGKKALGWKRKERPPGQYFNWLLNLIYQWISYFFNPGDRTVSKHHLGSTWIDSGWAYDPTDPHEYIRSTGSGGRFFQGWEVQAGATPKKFQYSVLGDGADDYTVTVYRVDGTSGGAPDVLGTHTVTNTPAAWAAKEIVLDDYLGDYYTFASTDRLVVEFSSEDANDSGSLRIKTGTLVYNRDGIAGR